MLMFGHIVLASDLLVMAYSMGDVRQVVPSISSAVSAIEARKGNESKLERNGITESSLGTIQENKEEETYQTLQPHRLRKARQKKKQMTKKELSS